MYDGTALVQLGLTAAATLTTTSRKTHLKPAIAPRSRRKLTRTAGGGRGTDLSRVRVAPSHTAVQSEYIRGPAPKAAASRPSDREGECDRERLTGGDGPR